MLVNELLTTGKTTFSFEFFPPKTAEGVAALFKDIEELQSLDPSFVSVTYGAGGSTRDRTRDLVIGVSRKTGLPVVAHLTCTNSSEKELEAILTGYADNGIDNILVLRGDPPSYNNRRVSEDQFAHAADLVSYIKKRFPAMCVGVAGFPEGHPETPNRLKEIDYLKAKVDRGADFIITQLFFDNRDFYDFCERCELAGITVPIIAGIMPVTSYDGMVRLAELAAGARIPAQLLKAIAGAENDTHVERVGTQWAAEQVRDLLVHGARGIHLYTLNGSGATMKIFQTLGVTSSKQLPRQL